MADLTNRIIVTAPSYTMASQIAAASLPTLPTAAELLAEFPEAVSHAVLSFSSATPKLLPLFNYHEMDSFTLRGILAVTASVHPEAEMIGKELRTRNAVQAYRKLCECESVHSWLTPRLEDDRTQLEALLEQDDRDRQNFMSSGMSFVILEERTRANYEEALQRIVDELDARAIESSLNEAYERATTPPLAPEEADEPHCPKCGQEVYNDSHGNCYGCRDNAEYEKEEAERAELVKAGKCPDCARPKSENRHGQCLHCMDDQVEAEERAEREERNYGRRCPVCGDRFDGNEWFGVCSRACSNGSRTHG